MPKLYAIVNNTIKLSKEIPEELTPEYIQEYINELSKKVELDENFKEFIKEMHDDTEEEILLKLIYTSKLFNIHLLIYDGEGKLPNTPITLIIGGYIYILSYLKGTSLPLAKTITKLYNSRLFKEELDCLYDTSKQYEEFDENLTNKIHKLMKNCGVKFMEIVKND